MDSWAAECAPPSYKEATSRLDWLALSADHVDWIDCVSLCRVCRRAWRLFAPRLWRNLLVTVRSAGLHPGDDLAWWFSFVFRTLPHIRLVTRALVRVLDARGFASDALHFASDGDTRLLNKSFAHAGSLLPGLTCIIVDNHPELSAAFLTKVHKGLEGRSLRLLSSADSSNALPAALFASLILQHVVYLDVSAVPGSIVSLLQPSLLPALRILKIRNREIDDAGLQALAHAFARRLWSLDVSGNGITDSSLNALSGACMPASSLRSDNRFAVEGKLSSLSHGIANHGQFFFIEESPWSGTFSHPERHFVDVPEYVTGTGASSTPSNETCRSDGASRIRSDSLDTAVDTLSLEEHHPELTHYCRSRGLQHLHISGNAISATGIAKLLRTSRGHLKQLDCASVTMLPPRGPSPTHWPPETTLHGILGASHLFRPVYSSNLAVLRIHHSLVTNVPTLTAPHLSGLERAYLAETSILQRVDEAYPQVFVPDMNPRLISLTLTCIPRRSSGPLAARLVDFLRLLSLQEGSIQKTAASAAASGCRPSWRDPRTLQGLRRLVLEFEPDPVDHELDWPQDLTAEQLTTDNPRRLSQLGVDEPQIQDRTLADTTPQDATETTLHSSSVAEGHLLEADRDSSDSVTCCGEWNGTAFSAPVWVGPRESRGIVGEYRRLVTVCGLRDGIGPVTPSQVQAGAPEGAYVYHTAWTLSIMPPSLTPPPRAALDGMQDVLAHLKAYRRAGRAGYQALVERAARGKTAVPLGEPHLYWTGTLTVSLAEDSGPLWR